jgi:PPOX class probable F420-dependent enzyme
VLTDDDRAFLTDCRRVVLSTIRTDGRPRLVPICFALDPTASVVFTPLDEKTKRTNDPFALARVRDIAADPRVTLLADRWDEDWSRLTWLRLEGHATLFHPSDPGHARVVTALRNRYPQYESQRLEDRPMIQVVVDRIVRWSAAP